VQPEDDRRVHCVDMINPLMLRLQASIEYKDGSQETVITDTSWKTADGPITHSAITEAKITTPADCLSRGTSPASMTASGLPQSK